MKFRCYSEDDISFFLHSWLFEQLFPVGIIDGARCVCQSPAQSKCVCRERVTAVLVWLLCSLLSQQNVTFLLILFVPLIYFFDPCFQEYTSKEKLFFVSCGIKLFACQEWLSRDRLWCTQIPLRPSFRHSYSLQRAQEHFTSSSFPFVCSLQGSPPWIICLHLTLSSASSPLTQLTSCPLSPHP